MFYLLEVQLVLRHVAQLKSRTPFSLLNKREKIIVQFIKINLVELLLFVKIKVIFSTSTVSKKAVFSEKKIFFFALRSKKMDVL